MRPAIDPPAKGSTNTDGVRFDDVSHLRTSGTSHVLPPGYRNGLSWRTCATLVGVFLSLSCATKAAKASALTGSTKWRRSPSRAGLHSLWTSTVARVTPCSLRRPILLFCRCNAVASIIILREHSRRITRTYRHVKNRECSRSFRSSNLWSVCGFGAASVL